MAAPVSPYDLTIARLRREIKNANGVVTLCRKQKSTTPLVAALKYAAELRCQLESAEEDRATEQETNPLERVRRRLRRATADRSWTAVANLTEQERAIEADQARAERERKEAEMRARGGSELEDKLVEMLTRCTPTTRANVIARLAPPDPTAPMN